MNVISFISNKLFFIIKFVKKIVFKTIFITLLFNNFSFTFAERTFSFISNQKELAIENYLLSLPKEQRIAQIFLVNIEGNRFYSAVETTASLGDTNKEVKDLVPGGCLFFNFNIANTAQEVIDFTSSIAEYCDSKKIIRPYIAIDQEGGVVNRLRNLTSTLPSNKKVSDTISPSNAYLLYSLQAKQLRSLGFDMNLAPVAEVTTSKNADFLATRSYGNQNKTIAYSIASVCAYQQNGISSVLKHFPGNTNTDPHTGLPEIFLDKKELEQTYIFPFAFALASMPSAVLMSHARTSAFDKNTPACLSSFWITKTLKNRFNYNGLVLSDDIFMGALTDNGFPPEKACVQAIEAGVDIIMLSEKKFAPVAKILLEYADKNPKFAERLKEAQKNIIRYKINCGILSLQKQKDGTYVVKPQSVVLQLGTKDSRLLDFKNAKQEGESFYSSFFN